MKKNYIVPQAKFIDLASEDSLLAGSLTGNEGQTGGGETTDQESNRRSIWDNTEW